MEVAPSTPSGRPVGAHRTAETAAPCGGVSRVVWTPGGGFGTVTSVALTPSSAGARGGYAVVGLCETDLAMRPGQRELIVSTVSGDLLILDADNLQVLWRTHIDGSAGFYNSILPADLNSDGWDEIYVAGSKGLWRFNQSVLPPQGNTFR